MRFHIFIIPHSSFVLLFIKFITWHLCRVSENFANVLTTGKNKWMWVFNLLDRQFSFNTFIHVEIRLSSHLSRDSRDGWIEWKWKCSQRLRKPQKINGKIEFELMIWTTRELTMLYVDVDAKRKRSVCFNFPNKLIRDIYWRGSESCCRWKFNLAKEEKREKENFFMGEGFSMEIFAHYHPRCCLFDQFAKVPFSTYVMSSKEDAENHPRIILTHF